VGRGLGDAGSGVLYKQSQFPALPWVEAGGRGTRGYSTNKPNWPVPVVRNQATSQRRRVGRGQWGEGRMVAEFLLPRPARGVIILSVRK